MTADIRTISSSCLEMRSCACVKSCCADDMSSIMSWLYAFAAFTFALHIGDFAVQFNVVRAELQSHDADDRE